MVNVAEAGECCKQVNDAKASGRPGAVNVAYGKGRLPAVKRNEL